MYDENNYALKAQHVFKGEIVFYTSKVNIIRL
jgi:hypothetical protein